MQSQRVALAAHHAAATYAADAQHSTCHGTVRGHVEAGNRARACLARLSAPDVWSALRPLPPRRASSSELRLCHDADHLASLEASSALAATERRPLFLPRGGHFAAGGRAAVAPQLAPCESPGRETFVTGGSMEAARAAVGGLLALVDEAFEPEGARRGLALCRPPGHHAGRACSEGFCLLNNVAVAAAYARATQPALVKRVLIFDWDVHHGQGTQDIFWSDPHILYISAHRGEEGFYPGSGGVNEVGEGLGLGFTVNIPLPEGYGDACLWAACAEVLLPAARRFRPDLILVSAGFDAAAEDPLGGGSCSARGFGAITRELVGLAAELCDGRILLALEGGYSLEALMACIGEVGHALVDSPPRLGGTPFGEAPAWLGSAVPGVRAALHAARVAHRAPPLRLLEGYAAKLMPFAPARRKAAVVLNALPEALASAPAPAPAPAFSESSKLLPTPTRVTSPSDSLTVRALSSTTSSTQRVPPSAAGFPLVHRRLDGNSLAVGSLATRRWKRLRRVLSRSLTLPADNLLTMRSPACGSSACGSSDRDSLAHDSLARDSPARARPARASPDRMSAARGSSPFTPPSHLAFSSLADGVRLPLRRLQKLRSATPPGRRARLRRLRRPVEEVATLEEAVQKNTS